MLRERRRTAAFGNQGGEGGCGWDCCQLRGSETPVSVAFFASLTSVPAIVGRLFQPCLYLSVQACSL